jgi:pimeloyl-ACP methyl ester carboxylesterase
MRPAFEDLVPQAYMLPGGVQLHAVRAGSGDPLVFIHGAMGDWRSWAPQWEAFTARFDCISYSRRYSYPNDNAMPSPDHGAFHEAQDLVQLLDALHIPRAILVGSSYGGFTALALAVTQPQRVRALVCIEPPMMKYADLSPQGHAEAQKFRTQVIAPALAAFRAGDDVRASHIMTSGIGGAGAPLPSGAAMQRRLQNMRAMRMLALSSDEFPWISPGQLAALEMPLLLLSGCDTPAVHAAIFSNLCAHLPQACQQRVAGAGHSVTRDQPEVFNRLALDFLATAAMSTA